MPRKPKSCCSGCQKGQGCIGSRQRRDKPDEKSTVEKVLSNLPGSDVPLTVGMALTAVGGIPLVALEWFDINIPVVKPILVATTVGGTYLLIAKVLAYSFDPVGAAWRELEWLGHVAGEAFRGADKAMADALDIKKPNTKETEDGCGEVWATIKGIPFPHDGVPLNYLQRVACCEKIYPGTIFTHPSNAWNKLKCIASGKKN